MNDKEREELLRRLRRLRDRYGQHVLDAIFFLKPRWLREVLAICRVKGVLWE